MPPPMTNPIRPNVWAGVWTPEGTWSGGRFYSRHSPASASLYDARCEVALGTPMGGDDDKTAATCKAKFLNPQVHR